MAAKYPIKSPARHGTGPNGLPTNFVPPLGQSSVLANLLDRPAAKQSQLISSTHQLLLCFQSNGEGSLDSGLSILQQRKSVTTLSRQQPVEGVDVLHCHPNDQERKNQHDKQTDCHACNGSDRSQSRFTFLLVLDRHMVE